MTFFCKPTISLWSFIFFLLFFPVTSFIIFLFCSIFYLHIPLFLIEYFVHLPTPPWWNLLVLLSYLVCQFYFTFLSLLTSLNFQSNFGPYYKEVRLYFSTSHTSHITNTRAVSSVYQYIWSAWLHILTSGELQVTLRKSLFW